jgi:hypothetical protein
MKVRGIEVKRGNFTGVTLTPFVGLGGQAGDSHSLDMSKLVYAVAIARRRRRRHSADG